MKVPKHWAMGAASGVNERGKTVSFSCWHWSDQGEDDARRLAQARAEAILSRYLRGEKLNSYSYGTRPPREEIVRSISDGRKNEIALVTRNGYGALVLNAARAMFMDVDLEPEPWLGFLARWLGRSRNQPSAQEQKRLQEISAWAERRRDLSLRVYRTRAGFRGLITNQTFDPAAAASAEMMKELNCDPLYIKLCQRQECFRARLTPKPWRINIVNPPARYPFSSAESEAGFRRWLDDYERQSSSFAVCRLVAQIGNGQVIPEIEPVLSLHDQFCCGGPERGLA